MSGNKLQVAMLTGLIVGGVVLLQNSMPCLANSAGLLYLRAEYKLATGDTAAAIKLMQQAASPQRQETPKAAEKARSGESCPQAAAPRRIASTRKAPSSALNPVLARPLQRAAVNLPDKWEIRQARIMAQLSAGQAERDRHMKAAMQVLQARLKDLPVPPAAPTAPMAFSLE